jgi:hypothetical protein
VKRIRLIGDLDDAHGISSEIRHKHVPAGWVWDHVMGKWHVLNGARSCVIERECFVSELGKLLGVLDALCADEARDAMRSKCLAWHDSWDSLRTKMLCTLLARGRRCQQRQRQWELEYYLLS